ncbi:MAG TPA: OmpA family protein [Bacteroidales bacterium]|nr:OmpA family protein [Bacteroidales bacterium]
MKKLKWLLALVLLLSFVFPAQSQTGQDKGIYFKFQSRLKAGMGQTFKALPSGFDDITIVSWRDTNTYSDVVNDFLKTKWGFYGGGNFDFYFHKNFGFGVDVDYFRNKLEFIIPDSATNYVESHQDQFPPVKLMESMHTDQSLIFVGIGPSFKAFTNDHWDIDINIRGGLSHLKMGSLLYRFTNVQEDLNRIYDTLVYYDYSRPVNAFGLKAGLFVNYWFNSWIGVTLGADFIHTFVSAKKIDDDPDYILKYKNPEYYMRSDGTFDSWVYFDQPMKDYHPTKFNVNHLSVSAGVVFRFIKPEVKAIKPEVVKPELQPKDIVVLVKDSISGIPMKGVTVNLKEKSGNIRESKITEDNGKVVFSGVAPGDYTVSGILGSLKTNVEPIAKSEFDTKKDVIYKELLLNNLNFILEGITEECTKKKVLGNVEVELTDKTTGKVTKTKSGEDGLFTFNLAPNTDYSIVGIKDGYYSGFQEITTKGLKRSKTLFVKLTLCVEQLEVGKTFVLNNIYYDFDKCNIRADASVELDRLVEIMKENSGMEIELSSHTDQRGTGAYNEKLSQCRAESAVSYIVNKGIDKTRITAKGYGESRLLNDCTLEKDCPQTSEGDCPCHQNNRRTEVKITRMK